MKAVLAALALALLGAMGIAACGESHKASSPTTRADSNAVTGQSKAAGDVTTAKAFDSDDAPVRFFGHEASAAERQPIVALITRYYALAAKGDGVHACPLIHSLVVESIAEEYGSLPALRAKTCGAIVSNLFRQRHSRLVLDSTTLEITSVRVEGNRALVLLRFAKAPVPNYIPVHREGRAWKIWELFDGQMP